ERVVDSRPAVLLLVPLQQRKVGHPQEAPGVRVDQSELAAEVEAKGTEYAGDEGGLVRTEEDGRARLCAKRRQLGLGEELRDRRAGLALLGENQVGEPLCAPLL